MGKTAPVVRLGEELLSCHLLAGISVPQAELGAKTTIGLAGDAADDKRLGVDRRPILKARSLVRIGDLFDERRFVDRRKQS
ncbi:hypothetical protein D3C71_1592400 [compost metagenome]